jgi:hypothetical protein
MTNQDSGLSRIERARFPQVHSRADWCLISLRVKPLRILKRLSTVVAVLIGSGLVVLTVYGLVVKTQAESLLRDITSLRVGVSGEAEVQRLVQRHKRYAVDQRRDEHSLYTEFRIENLWLSTLRLEPPASFRASVNVQDGKVIQIFAGLFREMDIYPTFGASAGMVKEDLETSRRHEYRPSHYYFPTPVGKPYLRVELDSAASELQRKHAYDFSFRCLTKPGWGCDLSCDYLPSAWQDWRESLKGSDLYPTYFYERYPKSTRCTME